MSNKEFFRPLFYNFFIQIICLSCVFLEEEMNKTMFYMFLVSIITYWIFVVLLLKIDNLINKRIVNIWLRFGFASLLLIAYAVVCVSEMFNNQQPSSLKESNPVFISNE